MGHQLPRGPSEKEGSDRAEPNREVGQAKFRPVGQPLLLSAFLIS